MRQFILAGLVAAAFAVPSLAADAQRPAVQLKVKDLSSTFVDFYEAANKPAAPATPATPAAPAADGKPATPAAPAAPAESETDRRWRLFKHDYNFTAQADDTAARAALEAAWPKYAAAMDSIGKGFDAIAGEPTPIIDTISKQLYLSKQLTVRLVYYVGTFDGKVWSKSEGDITNIYLPLEVAPAVRDVPMARTIARLEMDQVAVFGNHPRNLAELVIAEGALAQTVRKAVPNQSVEAYLDLTPEQLAAVKASAKADFSAILGKLENGSADTLAEYSGPKLAQARYAGWMLADAQLKKNARIEDMIRQKPTDLVKALRQSLAALNAHNH